MITYDADEKDKTMGLAAVNKSKKKFRFFMTFKIWGRIWISIKMKSRIRIGIKTMPIHNNACILPMLYLQNTTTVQCATMYYLSPLQKWGLR